jgi:hypothetical protein
VAVRRVGTGVDLSMIYLGKVAKKSGSKLFVTINELGGTRSEFGPLKSVMVPEESPGVTYQKGDRVVVAQIGAYKEDLVVIGKLN